MAKKIIIGKTGTDLNSGLQGHVVFDSTKAALSIKKRVTLSITTQTGDGSGSGQKVYTHGFGYKPRFLAWTDDFYGGKTYLLPAKNITDYTKETEIEEILKASIDETIIQLDAFAHEYEPIQGGADDPVARTYNVHVIFFMESIRV